MKPETVDIIKATVRYCEMAAAGIGLLLLRKWWGTIWKYFPFYLLFIVAGEFTGKYLSEHVGHLYNNLYYSYIQQSVTYLFFFMLFYRYNKTINMSNRIVGPIILIYTGGLLLELFFINKKNSGYNSFSFSLGALLLLVLLIQFFLRFIFNSDILGYRRNMMFWFCCAVSAYYISTYPFYALRNTLYKKYPDVFNVYWIIAMCLSVLMYLLFAFSFIWAKPK